MLLYSLRRSDKSPFASRSMLLVFNAAGSTQSSFLPASDKFPPAARAPLVWSLGLMPLTNTPMSLGLSMMIPLVLAMALVYAIRYLNCFYRQPPLGKFHHDGQNECYSALVVPSLLCGITTRVGFLSLGMSPLPGIREMGIYVGFGILACIWFTSVFLPALLIGIPISEEVFTRITGPILLDE